MNVVDKATATQLKNIQTRTGKTSAVGLNMKGVQAGERLIELPPGGMCQYRVRLTEADEVDGELTAWIRQAYESAG